MDAFKNTFGKVTPPAELGDLGKEGGLNLFINNAITLFYTVAGLAFVIMLLWGGFNWVTAGGDKNQIESARITITRAIMGIVFLSLVFTILTVIGMLTGFEFYTGQKDVLNKIGVEQEAKDERARIQSVKEDTSKKQREGVRVPDGFLPGANGR